MKLVADRAFQMLETKVIRRVRTEAGVRRYKQPIGSIIINDGILVGLEEVGVVKNTSIMKGANGKKYNIRLEPRPNSSGKHYVGREGDTPGKGRTVFASHDEVEVLAEIAKEVQTEAGLEVTGSGRPGSSGKREGWTENQVQAAGDEISSLGNSMEQYGNGLQDDLYEVAGRLADGYTPHRDLRVARHELEQLRGKAREADRDPANAELIEKDSGYGAESILNTAIDAVVTEGKLPKRYNEAEEAEYAANALATAGERANQPRPVKTSEIGSGMWVQPVDNDGNPTGDWVKVDRVSDQSMSGRSKLIRSTDRDGKDRTFYRMGPRDKWQTIGDPKDEPRYVAPVPPVVNVSKRVDRLQEGDFTTIGGDTGYVVGYSPEKVGTGKYAEYRVALADDKQGTNKRFVRVPPGTMSGPETASEADDLTPVPNLGPPTFTNMKSEYDGYEKLKLANGKIVYTEADDESTDVYDENDVMLGNFKNGPELRVALNSMGTEPLTAKTPNGYDSVRHPNLSEAESEYDGYDKFVGRNGVEFYLAQEDGMTVAYDKNDKELGRSADRGQMLDALNTRVSDKKAEWRAAMDRAGKTPTSSLTQRVAEKEPVIELPKNAPNPGAPLKRLKSKFDGWKRFKLADGRVVDTGQATDDDGRWYATGPGGWDEIVADGDSEDEMMAKLRVAATPMDQPVSFSPGNTDVVPKRSKPPRGTPSPIAGMTMDEYNASRKRVSPSTRDAILGTGDPSTRGRRSSGERGAFDVTPAGEVLPQNEDEQLRQDEAEAATVAATGSVEERIAAAYNDIPKKNGKYVSLADLRDRLTGMSRTEQDDALLKLLASGTINLEPEAFTNRVDARARDNAIYVGGEDRHIVAFNRMPKPAKASVDGFMSNEVAASVIGQEADYNADDSRLGAKWTAGAVTRAREIRDRLRDGTIDTPEAVRRLNAAADSLSEGPVDNQFSASELRQLGIRLSNYDNRSAAEIREAAKAKRVEMLREARGTASKLNQENRSRTSAPSADPVAPAAPERPARTPRQETLTPDTSGERSRLPIGSQTRDLERDPNTVFRNGRQLKDADAKLLNMEGNNGKAQNRLVQPANINLNNRMMRVAGEDREAFVAIQDRATENYLNGMTHAGAWKEAIETAEKIPVPTHGVQEVATNDGYGKYDVVRRNPDGSVETVATVRAGSGKTAWRAKEDALGRMRQETSKARTAATRRVPLTGPVVDTPAPANPAAGRTAGATGTPGRAMTEERAVEIESNLRMAYNQAFADTGTEQFIGEYVMISTVRKKLDALGYSRAEQDAVLLGMNRKSDVSIVPESNQKVLTPEQRAGAIVIGNQDKHLIAISDNSGGRAPIGSKPRSESAERADALMKYTRPGTNFRAGVAENLARYRELSNQDSEAAQSYLEAAEVSAGLRRPAAAGAPSNAPAADMSSLNAKDITENQARMLARTDPGRYMRLVGERYFSLGKDLRKKENKRNREVFDEMNRYADILDEARRNGTLPGAVQSVLMQIRVGHAGMMGIGRTMMTIRKVLNEEFGK